MTSSFRTRDHARRAYHRSLRWVWLGFGVGALVLLALLFAAPLRAAWDAHRLSHLLAATRAAAAQQQWQAALSHLR